MTRIKDMIIIPFRSCRKSMTAAVLGTASKGHAAAAAPLIAASDEEEDDDVGAASAPHIVLRMHLHCASCAAKIERVVMDIPGVEKVATDVEASRVTVTGTADAAAVATSVQVRTRRPVTVVRDGRSGARERSAAAAGTPRDDQQLVRARGRSTAAQVMPVPVPERTAARQAEEEEIAGRQSRQEQQATAGWTAEVRIAGLGYCGRCISRIVQRVSRFQGVREIKLTLPDPATTRCRRSSSSSSVRDSPRMNQQHRGQAA